MGAYLKQEKIQDLLAAAVAESCHLDSEELIEDETPPRGFDLLE